ncbi:alpha/beta hydrolase family protein [Humibacter ginsenosidimutans]|uniref:Alpha/beta hydrolase n=1 Tax=Humibacter ginsenosidimutans TaxID=2599293 RepID=A0A5B8M695_9MICO|nr:alpha/beta hydrolase [Humibacter ginsenosidimutans]QDZ15826.1 alpha/beta hydrolase [Humibacter ginsenosidimutans]
MAAVAVEGVDPTTGKRSIENAREWLYAHLDERAHPFNAIDVDAARPVVDRLESIEPEAWAAAWLEVAHRFAEQADAAHRDGRTADEREAWWQAYQFAFVARFPTPIHPAKQAAYDLSREWFQRAVALDDPAVERVAIPTAEGGREGRTEVVFYVARPREVEGPTPVAIVWGGIDMWKEESYVRTASLRGRGVATIHIDMPGVGEAPVFAGPDAERMWTPVFDWIERSDLDETRVGIVGQSFGGYWSTKLAHTHRDRLKAAVNWGGGIHKTFQPAWQEKSRSAGTYLMDLGPSRARIFGEHTFDEYIARCPELSLLDQGVLDQPCCPLLLVNGIDDQQNDATDIHLALEHGDPKTARLFPGGHMGRGPVGPTVINWLVNQLS